MDIRQLVDKINTRFKSGNSIPVERTHITAEEWAVINNAPWNRQVDDWRLDHARRVGKMEKESDQKRLQGACRLPKKE